MRVIVNTHFKFYQTFLSPQADLVDLTTHHLLVSFYPHNVNPQQALHYNLYNIKKSISARDLQLYSENHDKRTDPVATTDRKSDPIRTEPYYGCLKWQQP